MFTLCCQTGCLYLTGVEGRNRMIRLLKHYIPHAVLLLAFLDFVLLLGAAEAGWIFRAHQIGMAVEPLPTRYIPLVSFALSLQVALIAVGVYGPEALQSLRFAQADRNGLV